MALDHSGGANLSGYSTGGGATTSVASVGGGLYTPEVQRGGDKDDYWSLARCKRAYSDYLGSKRLEIQEQQEARRYRHGSHWTAAQIDVLNRRKQPVVTYNRVGRKIDGIVGLAEKLKQDPKAYPTAPKHQMGADLATAAIRSALESQKWEAKAPKCASAGAIDGIGGLEMLLVQDDEGNYDVTLEPIDIDGFFYDPRSKKDDFADARYMGMGKWLDADTAKDVFPGHDEDIDNSVGRGRDLTSDSDADSHFFMASGDLKTIRLVYICYRHKGGWCWAMFTGSVKLMEGQSQFVDKKGKPVCSFLMFSAAVDHDGDRYGFVRNLKSAQDEINQRRSKGLHELNTRRIIAEKGAFDDIEKTRIEATKPDGIVERNKGYEADFDDQKKQADIAGQLRFLEDAKAEIENFGPNPALLGDTGINNRSGRAIALMQQAGIAELGPYMMAYRDWKLRVYEAVYFGIRKYWTNERWIRVSDDDGQQQMVQINTMQVDPMTGAPTMVNSIGELDVDIMLDEGPDSVTMMQDMYETLSQIIPAIAPMLSPPEVQAVVSMLVETSPLAANIKKRFRDAQAQAQQPNPMAQQMEQLQLAGAQATVQETQSKATLNMAKAQSEGIPDISAPPQQMEFQLPPEIQITQAMADIDKTRADAEHKRSLATAEHAYTRLAPIDLAQKAFDAAEGRSHDSFNAAQDRVVQLQQIKKQAQRPANAARQ